MSSNSRFRPNSEQHVLTAALPCPIKDLCLVTMTTATQRQNDTSSNNINSFQHHIFKCRELIFTNENVIASPNLGDDRILVIMKKVYYETDRKQFDKYGLEMSHLCPASSCVISSCLSYTIAAHLAPQWNKVEDVYIEGRDFLSWSQRSNATRIELHLADDRIELAVTPHNVKLIPARVEDFGIGPRGMYDLYNTPTSVVDTADISNPWCYVLPSYKKGMVVGICRSIPESSPFKCYRDMKRYWKNYYGYRLPDEESYFYFNIQFLPLRGRVFTYPECCVRSQELVVLDRCNMTDVTSRLCKTLSLKFNNLFAETLTFNGTPQYPTLELNQYKGLSVSSTVNLTSAGPYWTQGRSTTIAPREHSDDNRCSSLNKENIGVTTIGVRQDNGMKHTMKHGGIERDSTFAPQNQVPRYDQRTRDTVPPVVDPSKFMTDENMKRFDPGFKFAPTFKSSTMRQSGGPCGAGGLPEPKQGPVERIVPRFRPSAPQGPIHNPPVTVTGDSGLSIDPYAGAQSMKQPCTVQRSSTFMAPLVSGHASRETGAPRIVPRFKSLPSQHRSAAPRPSGLPPSAANSMILSVTSSRSNSATTRPIGGLTSINRTIAAPPTAALGNCNANVSRPNQNPMQKRKSLSGDEKKPRSKPKHQDFNIAQLAALNQLGKANALTLTTWLREKGVVVKTKDKKPELIDKVAAYLGLKRPSPNPTNP